MIDNYYIYIYLDPRKSGQYCYKDFCFLSEPMYIGKGKGKRYKEVGSKKRSQLFINKINKIKQSGLEPIVFKLYENLNENQSFELEKNLIKEIGRIDLNFGSLLNMTDGGEGISGFTFSKFSKIKMSNSQKGKFKSEESVNKKKINYQEIKNEFKKRGYQLLMEKSEYKNSFTKLNYICPEGHKDSMNWSNFKQGRDCPICYSELCSENIGEKSHNHKLTEEQVIQIKLLLKEGKLTQQEIADMFGVNRTTISAIKTEKIWTNIKI